MALFAFATGSCSAVWRAEHEAGANGVIRTCHWAGRAGSDAADDFGAVVQQFQVGAAADQELHYLG